MTAAELRAKWEQRRQEWKALGVQVDGAAIADELLRDLDSAADAEEDAVTLREASEIGGYSVDHLERLVREGKITNVGGKHRPRIARAAVPLKPGYLRLERGSGQVSSRRRIVASVANAETEA